MRPVESSTIAAPKLVRLRLWSLTTLGAVGRMLIKDQMTTTTIPPSVTHRTIVNLLPSKSVAFGLRGVAPGAGHILDKNSCGTGASCGRPSWHAICEGLEKCCGGERQIRGSLKLKATGMSSEHFQLGS